MTYARDVGTHAKDHDSVANQALGMSKANYYDDVADAPLLDRVVVDATGLLMTLHFDRPITSPVDPELGWTITTDTIASSTITGNRLNFVLTTGQKLGVACTVAYVAATGDITSTDGTALADIATTAAYNMSTVPA